MVRPYGLAVVDCLVALGNCAWLGPDSHGTDDVCICWKQRAYCWLCVVVVCTSYSALPLHRDRVKRATFIR